MMAMLGLLFTGGSCLILFGISPGSDVWVGILCYSHVLRIAADDSLIKVSSGKENRPTHKTNQQL